MQKETIFDNMMGWTHENSHTGLDTFVSNSLIGRPEVTIDSKVETTVNQLLTFMVRDLEKKYC